MKEELLRIFEGFVTSDPKVRGGELVLKGTRFPLSHLIANLAPHTPGWPSLEHIAEDFDLDIEVVYQIFRKLALHIESL
jgi:uncharacterized protein (DUF433 family)